MYKQVWSAVVGDVLQCEWETRNRAVSHAVAVAQDSPLLATFRALFPKVCFFIFVKLDTCGVWTGGLSLPLMSPLDNDIHCNSLCIDTVFSVCVRVI